MTQPHGIERDEVRAPASDAPDLGVENDLDVVKAHPFEPQLLQRDFCADVGDW